VQSSSADQIVAFALVHEQNSITLLLGLQKKQTKQKQQQQQKNKVTNKNKQANRQTKQNENVAKYGEASAMPYTRPHLFPGS